MEITLRIPDEIAQRIAPQGKDAARLALEALALEGYRSEALTEHEVCEMLGLDSRLEVHAFLKQHGVYLRYDRADLDRDMAAARELGSKFPVDATSRANR